MMSHLEPIDTEMTPMRRAVRDRQVELGIGASAGASTARSSTRAVTRA